MKNIKEVVEKLCLFNNRTFTKKQWEIVLEGCDCPKSANFWTALRETNLQRYKFAYTLVDANEESITDVFRRYRKYAYESVKKSAAKKKARERVKSIKGHVFFMVDGALTTEKPSRDE